MLQCWWLAKKPCCLIVLPKLSEWNKWDLGVHGEPVVTLKYQPSNAIQKKKERKARVNFYTEGTQIGCKFLGLKLYY